MRPRLQIDNPPDWAQILFLIGICLFLYFFNLGRTDLWAPDEPRYAQIAKEIVSRGDWILMHINGRVYGDKPPLFFWLMALSSYLWSGFTSFSTRFPSALFGTLTVLLTFLFGKKLYSSWTGFISGLMLATSLHFAYLSTRVNIDATLTFFTTASLFCFFSWHRENQSEEIRHRRRRSILIYGFYVGMAFATLAKGPIGFILPLLVSLVYLLVQKDFQEMKRMKWISGIPLMLAIILAWYLPAVWAGGKTYVEQNLFRHTTQAYRTGWTHPQPFCYYLYSFPVAFFPWIFFLPSSMFYGWCRSMVAKRKEFLFLFAWFIVLFVFFSLSRSKRTLYLLPLFPAASLMVGKLWSDLIQQTMDRFKREWISFPLAGFSGLVLVAGVALPWVVAKKSPDFLFYSLPVAFLFAAWGATLMILWLYRYHRAILFLLIGVTAAVYFYGFGVIFPLANSQMSARFISEEISSRFQPGDRIAVFRGLETDPYNYYTGIAPILVLLTPSQLHQFVNSQERVFCILNYRDFSQIFGKEGEPKVQLIARRRVRSDDVALISNR